MERLCRLCLKVINDDNFEIIEEIEKEMLEVLLLKLDLSWSEKTIMCNHCIEQLEKSFEFKATCLYTEDYIFPLIKQNSKIDMRQIYNNERRITISIAANENVCRLCMGVFENSFFYSLEEVNGDMLQKCIPEVNLTITQRTLFCKTCLTSLTCYFNFASVCMETNKKMKTFLKNGRILNTPYVYLSRMKLFTSSNTSPVVRDGDLKNMEDDYKTENESKLSDTSSGTKDSKSQGNLRIKHRSKENKNKCAKDKETSTCDICSRTCASKYSLADHKLIMHGESVKLYKCDKCLFISKYRGSLLKHKVLHKSSSETKVYKCDKCQYQTIRKSYLKGHALIHQKDSESVLYKCEHCPYKTKRRQALGGHMLTHKTNSEVKMLSCNFCSFKTKWKSGFSSHEKTHKSKSEMATYDCSHCQYKAKRKDTLSRHVRTHKNINEVVLYKCNTCGRQFREKTYLTKHMLMHKDQSEIKLYSCEKCPYVAKRKNNLSSHMMMHMDCSQLNIFKCESCPYKTNRRSNLKMHSLNHKNYKPPTIYKCMYCSYQNTAKSPFQIHLHVMHNDNSLGAAPIFNCAKCSYQTTYRSTYRAHLQTHSSSSGVLYQCQTCGSKFNKGYLNMHQRTCVGQKEVKSESFNEEKASIESA